MTIRVDMTEDQLRDMTQPLTPAHITELCELRASAKAAAEMFTLAIAEAMGWEWIGTEPFSGDKT